MCTVVCSPSWHITCLEPLLRKLSMLFRVLGLWLQVKEMFFLGSVGPRVNSLGRSKCKWDLHRKVQNQQSKNITNIKKDVGMASQKYVNNFGMIYK